MEQGVGKITDAGYQVIWQTGKNFGDRGKQAAKGLKGIVVTPFITDMSGAYAAADLVVSRAGAGSISELELLGKPCILVPSPNVAEDHQTKNARALADKDAAVLIPDSEAKEKLVPEILRLMADPKKLEQMSANIRQLALPDSDDKIVDEVIKILDKK